MRCHEYQKSIYILDGQIIFAFFQQIDDRLGESLLRNGRVPLRPLLIASKMVKAGKRLGSILVNMNVLLRKSWWKESAIKFRDIIHSLFRVTKGQYELALKDVNTHEMILLNMSTEDIIFDGVKSINSWTRILKGIGTIQRQTDSIGRSIKIDFESYFGIRRAAFIFIVRKGQFTVEEICTMSYMSNFETCKHLWAFMMVGILDSIEPQDQKDQHDYHCQSYVTADMEYEFHDLVENYNDLFSHVYDFAFGRVEDQAEVIAKKLWSK